MKKRLFVLLSAVVLICVLSGCFFISVPYTFTGETVEGRSLAYDFDKEDEEKMSALMDECSSMIKNGADYAAFEKKYYSVINLANHLNDAESKEELKFFIYGDQSNRNESDRLGELYVDFLQWYNATLHEIADGAYRTEFFKNMSDEEIANRVGRKYPDEYYAAKKEMDAVKSEYYLLDASKSSYYADVDALYVRYVKAAQILAKLDGEKDYLDYAYKNVYGRGYKVEDTDDFFTYVKQYVCPAYLALLTEYVQGVSERTASEYEVADNFRYGDGFTEQFDKFAAYKDAVGGKMRTAYNGLWKRGGRFYVSYEDGSYAGAFTNTFPVSGQPYVFFGQGYHDIMTVVHEFGHYFAAYIGKDVNGFDLAETQSQANEHLFLQFIVNQKYYDDNVTALIVDEKILESYQSIILCAIINELEKRVYADDDLTAGETDAYVDAILSEMGEGVKNRFDVKKYWRMVALDSAGYYISYSTSLVGALNVYKIAQEDFNKGAQTYLKLVDRDPSTEDLMTVYGNAGLGDPFSEETFIFLFGTK